MKDEGADKGRGRIKEEESMKEEEADKGRGDG